MRDTPETNRRSWRSVVAAHSRPLTAFAILLACVLSAALLTAGPANAASRGFTVTNNSSGPLRLESATRVHHTICGPSAGNGIHCVPGVAYAMAFEGRPQDGTVINPGGSQRWELKYAFDPFALLTVQYAAKLTYKIEHTNGKVEFTIETTPTTNDSSCQVIPASDGVCTAAGVNLSFRR
jgi:hypothetical protein